MPRHSNDKKVPIVDEKKRNAKRALRQANPQKAANVAQLRAVLQAIHQALVDLFGE